MLKISRLTAHLEFPEPARFPYWMGNAFRGGFGVHLRRACCPDLKKDCLGCEIREDCIFYHTHVKNESKVGYGAPPKPIIFIPPFFGKSMIVEENGFLDVDILVFGKFIRYLPHVILGLRLLGQNGIGYEKQHNRFRLDEIRCNFSGELAFDGFKINSEAIEEVELWSENFEEGLDNEKLKIAFKTPIMIKTGDFPPNMEKLLDMIRHRLILYVNEYGDGEKIPDFKCKATITASNAHFHKLISNSQRTKKKEFHTYTGTVEYLVEEMDSNTKQLLKIGSLIGAGPKPSFGLGFMKTTNE